MISDSQKQPIADIKSLVASNRQSILIAGPAGCGKSYIVQQWANMMSVDDYVTVEPKVSSIRDALDNCLLIDNKVVIEIENLDSGVPAASYTLLKSLEEPSSHIYFAVTCRNANHVPDTIISRSAVIHVGPPTISDINNYGKDKDLMKYNNVCNSLVWKCARSFSDVDDILNMTLDEVQYYESLADLCKFNDSVSNLVWKLGHYDSNKECNLELAIRSVVELMHNPFVTKCGIDCIRDLTRGRIAQHAVLAKFVFNAKFCE